MTATDQPISRLRRRFIEDMLARRLGAKTQIQYVRAVRQLADFLGRSPASADAEDLRRFQLHLVTSGIGSPTVNATLTALRFFFEVTLGRGEVLAKVQHVYEPRRLPVVLSPEEVTRLLAAAPGPKYRAALAVAYGAGLRASKVCGLKVGDVDSGRGLGGLVVAGPEEAAATSVFLGVDQTFQPLTRRSSSLRSSRASKRYRCPFASGMMAAPDHVALLAMFLVSRPYGSPSPYSPAGAARTSSAASAPRCRRRR